MKTKLFDPTYVREAVANGRRAKQIAADLGMAEPTLRQYAHRAGITLMRKRALGIETFEIDIPLALVETINARASEMGMSARRLIKSVICAVASDNLFKAVLDE